MKGKERGSKKRERMSKEEGKDELKGGYGRGKRRERTSKEGEKDE